MPNRGATRRLLLWISLLAYLLVGCGSGLALSCCPPQTVDCCLVAMPAADTGLAEAPCLRCPDSSAPPAVTKARPRSSRSLPLLKLAAATSVPPAAAAIAPLPAAVPPAKNAPQGPSLALQHLRTVVLLN